MLRLLPHKFKKIGLAIAPIGFLLWFGVQKGMIKKLGEILEVTDLRLLNMTVAIIGFFAFLFGTYAVAFSKEKVEDELITKVRLESLQLAALIQIVYLIFGLIWMGFTNNPPRDGGLLMFFIIAIALLWLIYIIRFNYVIHIRIYRLEK